MMEALEKTAEFKEAMRRIPAAVAVISALYQGERRGLTATAVCSVSADPPRMLACVNKQVRAHDPIGLAGYFGVNYLCHDQAAVAQVFAAPASRPEGRFSCGDWIEGRSGTPLLREALVTFECQVVQSVDCGTHTIYIGDIIDIAQRDDLSLLYKSGAFRAA